MSELIKYGSYQEYEQVLDTEITKATEGFVRIGYLLKVARDTDILKESGYQDVNELAQKRYGLDKTQVSRFIHINDRFSEGGYSDRLLEQYRGYGHTKLTVMLQLPEEITEELTPAYSRNELQAIREEVEEEQKITDLEVLMEEKDSRQQVISNTLASVMYQLGMEDPILYCRLHEIVMGKAPYTIKEVLAPQGTKLYTVRIAGVGRKMMFLEVEKSQFSIMDVRTNQKEYFGWDDMESMIGAMMCTNKSGKESWKLFYAKEFPEKEEIVPEQPAKKESKVQKAKVEKIGRTDDGTAKENDDGKLCGETETKPGAVGTSETGNGDATGTEEERNRGNVGTGTGNGRTEAAGNTESYQDTGRTETTATDFERAAAEETGEHESASDGTESHEPETAQSTGEEIASAQTEIIDKPYGTRKDYLDNCTEYGIASYLKKNLDVEYFRNCTIDDLEKWFLKEVDHNGREIEEVEECL